jgi:hypothetical protein
VCLIWEIASAERDLAVDVFDAGCNGRRLRAQQVVRGFLLDLQHYEVEGKVGDEQRNREDGGVCEREPATRSLEESLQH